MRHLILLMMCHLPSAICHLPSAIFHLPSAITGIAIPNHCHEHILKPFEVLAELRRVLKVRGQFVQVVPFDDWWKGVHRTWPSGDVDNHLYTCSTQNLGNLFSKESFEIESVKIIISALHPRFFWILTRLQPRAFAMACYVFGKTSYPREVLAVVQLPMATING